MPSASFFECFAQEKETALEETVDKLERDLQRVLAQRQKLEVHNQSLVELYESGSGNPCGPEVRLDPPNCLKDGGCLCSVRN